MLGLVLDEHETTELFTVSACSFAVCVSLLYLWRFLIAPAIPIHKTLCEDDIIVLRSSFVSFYPAATAPFLAAAALSHLAAEADGGMLAASPPTLALDAIGISLGYMLYDTIFCILHKPVRSPLIIVHHVLSVLFFPYATLRHRSVLFVLFFVLTEITNIGQHGRMMLLKLRLEHTKAYLVNGVTWAIAFFVVRILPSPFLFYKMVFGSYEAFSAFDFYLAILLMPVPFLLNAYWFYLILRGVFKFLSKPANVKGASRQQ